jgi:hypothetical protein
MVPPVVTTPTFGNCAKESETGSRKAHTTPHTSEERILKGDIDSSYAVFDGFLQTNWDSVELRTG